jgi:hypothetical protein
VAGRGGVKRDGVNQSSVVGRWSSAETLVSVTFCSDGSTGGRVVSNELMRRRWRLALPFVGLLLFAWVTVQSLPLNRPRSRYGWWSSIPLDATPHSKSDSACKDGSDDCGAWGPQSILVDSGLVARALMVCAFPAFILSALVVGGLGRLGISEVYSFMISTPLLIATWFYVLGWLLDRRKRTRSE